MLVNASTVKTHIDEELTAILDEAQLYIVLIGVLDAGVAEEHFVVPAVGFLKFEQLQSLTEDAANLLVEVLLAHN